MRKIRLLTVISGLVLGTACVIPSYAFAGTYSETTGSVAHTWTDYANAGGTEGPEIPSNETVQITCRVTGFTVQDGNDWWYQIASSPWNTSYYVSADAFYNNGATSGSLLGTPFYDPAVPVCSSSPPPTSGGGSPPPNGGGGQSTTAETSGSVVNTWTNYGDAGGTQGPSIASNETVQITCRVTGFTVQDGNDWWYQIASSPWNTSYYASADAFYNNGATSGSLLGTPFYDPAVPVCSSASPPPAPSSSGTVVLAQGAAAPAGYQYAVTLEGFTANTVVSVSCRDSIDPNGFYSFTLTTNSSGNASTPDGCYSGDGPDHWVVADGIQSNYVSWGAGSGVTPPGTGPTGSPPVTGVKSLPVSPTTNWSGYIGRGSNVSRVDATWTVPTVSCKSLSSSAVAIWAGIDGDDGNNHDLVQAGTEADCASPTARPSYYVWWESLPATEQPVAAVAPGDQISVVVYTDPGTLRYELIGVTVNGRQVIGESVPAASAARDTAECIVEAPLQSTATKRDIAKARGSLSELRPSRSSSRESEARRAKHHKHKKRHRHHKRQFKAPRHPGLKLLALPLANTSANSYVRTFLANFGTTTFSSCGAAVDGGSVQPLASGAATGAQDGGLNVSILDMISQSVTEATVNPPSAGGTAWSVTWDNI